MLRKNVFVGGAICCVAKVAQRTIHRAIIDFSLLYPHFTFVFFRELVYFPSDSLPFVVLCALQLKSA
jgi:hypothetical protein